MLNQDPPCQTGRNATVSLDVAAPAAYPMEVPASGPGRRGPPRPGSSVGRAADFDAAGRPSDRPGAQREPPAGRNRTAGVDAAVCWDALRARATTTTAGDGKRDGPKRCGIGSSAGK